MEAPKPRFSAGPMRGRATATMEPSSGAMKAPTQVSPSSAQRRSAPTPSRAACSVMAQGYGSAGEGVGTNGAVATRRAARGH